MGPTHTDTFAKDTWLMHSIAPVCLDDASPRSSENRCFGLEALLSPSRTFWRPSGPLNISWMWSMSGENSDTFVGVGSALLDFRPLRLSFFGKACLGDFFGVHGLGLHASSLSTADTVISVCQRVLSLRHSLKVQTYRCLILTRSGPVLRHF